MPAVEPSSTTATRPRGRDDPEIYVSPGVDGQARYNGLQAYCAPLGLTWELMTNVIHCVF
jgi:hypothetical protein